MHGRFELRNKKEKKSLIILAVNIQGKKLRKSTNLRIETKRWGSGRPKNLPENKGIIISLKSIEGRLNKLEQECYHQNKPITIDFLSSRIEDIITGKINHKQNLLGLFADFKSRKSNQLRAGSIKTYTTLHNHLRDYETQNKTTLHPDDMNKNFGEKFIQFLLREFQDINTERKRKPLQNPTINKMIRTLKAFCTYLNENNYTRTEEWKKIESLNEVDQAIVVLFPDELLKLEKFNPKNEKLQNAKDTFLFSCYTGLRYQDLNQVTEERITDRELRIALTNKNHKIAKIPLVGKAKDILKRNGNTLPIISNQNLNINIKELIKKAGIHRKIEMVVQRGRDIKTEFLPIHKVISIHDGRKTFITSCLMKGVHQNLVMELSTHSEYASFKRYISFSDSHKNIELNKVFD